MKRKVSKKSKRRLMIFGILSIVSIGYFFVTLFAYSYNYVSLKQEENNLNNKLDGLQTEKTNLKTEIEKLNNPEYVVRFAKEKYLYSKDGEYVLRIDNEKQEEVKKDGNKIYKYTIGLIIILLFILMVVHRKNKKRRK